MFSGTMIDDLISTVARIEANAETKVMMREQLEQVPFYAISRYETMRHEAVVMGVA